MVSKSKKAKTATGEHNASVHLSSKLASARTTNPSPLLKTAFSTSLQSSLFASVIRGLDAQRLRVHDIATSRLRCEHIFENGIAVNSLAWGTLRGLNPNSKKKKKRKRSSLSTGPEAESDNDEEDDDVDASQVVVGVAINKGKIYIFSPSQGAVTMTLEGGHPGNVYDFQFHYDGKTTTGWSTGGEKLIEWDLTRGTMIKTINLVDKMKIYRLRPMTENVFGASHTTYLININDPFTKSTPTFSSHTSQVHSLLISPKKLQLLTAAKADRFVSVSDIAQEKQIGSLVAQSDVAQVAINKTGLALAIVTTDGAVEFFDQPWFPNTSANVLEGDPELHSQRIKPLIRTSTGRVKIVRPSSENVRIIDVSFQGNELVMAWVENGINVLFEKILWTDASTGAVSIQGDVVISKSKSVGIGGSDDLGTVMNGVKDVGKTNISQANTIVVDGTDTQDIGMIDADDATNGLLEEDSNMQGNDHDEDEEEDEDEDETEEPTFAEKFNALQLSAKNRDAISDSNMRGSNVLVPSTGASLTNSKADKSNQFQDAISLTTVLSQALKTSDKSLLETCLHTTSVEIIHATVARLDSFLAADLITRLAELISRKPNRAGSLLVWVEETFIRHGGYLLALPDLVSRLAGLQRVLGRRADSLPKMLLLKGKLRMLTAQMENRNRSKRPAEDGPAVVYVEGENDDDSSSGDEASEIGNNVEEIGLISDGSEDEDGDGEGEEEVQINGVNGVLESADEEDEVDDFDDEEDEENEEDEGDEDAEGAGIYLDQEAEETDDDEGESESDLDGFVVSDGEIDYDDQDDDAILDDGSSEEEDEVIVPKTSKGKRRLVKGSAK